MRSYHPKLILAILLVSLCPLTANADETLTNSTTTTVPSITNNPPTTSPTTDTPTVTTSPTAAPEGSTSPTPSVTPASNATTPSTETNKQDESFESICISSWMKRFVDIKDKVGYKNFGQKYCACALTQPLDTDAAVDKAIQVCMTRILLKDAMNSLEDTVGLDKATDKEVNQACQDKWKLIYPQMSEQAQLNTTAFCSCAQPKLSELSKKSDNMTDKDYYTQIDSIAASCSDTIKPNQQPKT